MPDPEDLMHKACGWMLREIGKRDRSRLTAFLAEHAPEMPRTMLRYAIEHYAEVERQKFLATKNPGGLRLSGPWEGGCPRCARTRETRG
jgi:hypothetical protein